MSDTENKNVIIMDATIGDIVSYRENTYIESKIEIEGFHYWKSAPEEVSFLTQNHRHLFIIRARKKVNHDDRDVEFILFGRRLKGYLFGKYGNEEQVQWCEFGSMSCEMIARELMKEFDLDFCSVFEDDENGAMIEKEYYQHPAYK